MKKNRGFVALYSVHCTTRRSSLELVQLITIGGGMRLLFVVLLFGAASAHSIPPGKVEEPAVQADPKVEEPAVQVDPKEIEEDFEQEAHVETKDDHKVEWRALDEHVLKELEESHDAGGREPEMLSEDDYNPPETIDQVHEDDPEQDPEQEDGHDQEGEDESMIPPWLMPEMPDWMRNRMPAIPYLSNTVPRPSSNPVPSKSEEYMRLHNEKRRRKRNALYLRRSKPRFAHQQMRLYGPTAPDFDREVDVRDHFRPATHFDRRYFSNHIQENSYDRSFDKVEDLNVEDLDAHKYSKQGRSVAAHSRPVGTHGRPVAANGRPLAAHGRPVAAHGRPVTADGRHMAAYDRPVAAYDRPAATYDQLVAEYDRLVAAHGQSMVAHDRSVAKHDYPLEVDHDQLYQYVMNGYLPIGSRFTAKPSLLTKGSRCWTSGKIKSFLLPGHQVDEYNKESRHKYWDQVGCDTLKTSKLPGVFELLGLKKSWAKRTKFQHVAKKNYVVFLHEVGSGQQWSIENFDPSGLQAWSPTRQKDAHSRKIRLPGRNLKPMQNYEERSSADKMRFHNYEERSSADKMRFHNYAYNNNQHRHKFTSSRAYIMQGGTHDNSLVQQQ